MIRRTRPPEPTPEPESPTPARNFFGRFLMYAELAALACLVYIGHQAYLVWRPPAPGASAPAGPAPTLLMPKGAKAPLPRPVDSLAGGKIDPLPPEEVVLRGRNGSLRRLKVPRAAGGTAPVFESAPIAADSPALRRADEPEPERGRAARKGPREWAAWFIGKDPRELVAWIVGAFALMYLVFARGLRVGLSGDRRSGMSHD